MSRELSLDYLLKFLEFCKANLGYGPIVLGGWAIYVLTQNEMSVDIDILLKSKKDIDKIKPFFKENKFKFEQDWKGNITFEKDLEKPLEIDEIKIENIIFDIIVKGEPNELHEAKTINVPWSLCFDYNKKVKYQNVEFQIPLPELLLIYKVKAFRDRTYDKFSMMDHFVGKKIWHKRKDFKINKDQRDILNLINSVKIDTFILDGILSKTEFKTHFDETINKLLKK